MSFSRFSQIFKWRSNYQSNKMKVILKNQLLFYFWTSRIQQSQKIYNFYMKKWQERNFINLFKQFKSNLVNRRQLYTLSFTVPLLYSIDDWEKKRIYLDNDAIKYFNEFDHIERLKDPKLFENISTECYYKNGENPDDDVWEFYVQKDNMITWRKEQAIGQYAYKGFFKLIFFISIIFIILLLIASIIYIWAIKRYSTNLEHINRRLPEVDHNLLNHSILDLEALMLSVQNLGCAGMERLGNPPSSNSMLASLPSQRDNRSIRHSSIPVMQHDLINSTNGESQSFFKESKSQQLTSGIKYSSHNNCYTNCIVRSNCQMPHIPRPDGDFGRDTLSNHQYHAETTRSYIQAPPNKSIEDVPDASMTSHQLKSMKNCTKSSLKGSDSKRVAEKFKGFFKTISGGTNSNSNPLKSGTDLKTNSNVFTGAMCLSSSKSSNNFPSASTTSSLRGTTQHLHHHHHHQQQQHIGTSHDKMTEILKSNDASSTNKMQTSNCINSKEVEEKSISGTSSIQSSSSTTHIDYSSL
ncbi:unnamed protein product [Chironomus riparius]|uniref:Uncharacterized protein n=1 Tax=Chironomus riparius TaxID=315576 RepID=A0A9N9RN43_9DIPT|nr:unnamed protein product [Chironomus riparius]